MSPHARRRVDAADAPGILIASDKYKGTLTSLEVAGALRDGVVGARPEARVTMLAVADGGDGSLDVADAAGWSSVRFAAVDASGVSRSARIAMHDSQAMVEIASICGIGGRSPSGEEALSATSAGVGQAIRAALDNGARRIVLACGGSATSDAGAGMLTALGVRISDAAGSPVPQGAVGLAAAQSVDVSGLDPRLAHTELIIASDVDNPLLGPHGAAAVFGPQKGAGPGDIQAIEGALSSWVSLVAPRFGRDVSASTAAAAAGAAGGIGFGALLLGAAVVSGAGFFLDLVGFDEAARHSALVLTGEGRLDSQSARGKAPARVAERARAAGVPVHAVVGSCALEEAAWRSLGLDGVVALDLLDPACATDPDLSVELLRRVGRDLAQHVV